MTAKGNYFIAMNTFIAEEKLFTYQHAVLVLLKIVVRIGLAAIVSNNSLVYDTFLRKLHHNNKLTVVTCMHTVVDQGHVQM